MASRYSLGAFLSRARSALATPASSRSSPLTFIIGNESADLDSICSALLAAYLRSYSGLCSPTSNSNESKLHIPLAHIPRADLALRPELSAVLRAAGVSDADILTLDDLPSSLSLSPQETSWFLVDHNVPVGLLGPGSDLAKRSGGAAAAEVVGLIDHHEDEGAVAPGPHVSPRVVRKAGSCASLVAEHFRETWDGLAEPEAGEDGGRSAASAQLAMIALGPILVDTTNLGSLAKTTGTDLWAVEFAEGKLGGSGVATAAGEGAGAGAGAGAGGENGDYGRERFFRELAALKSDCSSMRFGDVFRKDYKAWTEGELELGISTSPQPFKYLLSSKPRVGEEEEGLVKEFEKWAWGGGENGQDLDVAALMTASTDEETGEFGREVMVWARGRKGVDAMKVFAERDGEGLGLTRWVDGETGKGMGVQGLDLEAGEGEWRVFWSQGNVKESRKQVAPRLREAMRKVANGDDGSRL
ncbi:hypothetical protein MKZ38_001072 [Zalerion maritima]|uniref:DHHA2 domain-containing protein n=1 Tax=Zalerion maritima TaxID=339359 RepID=A0AAD5RQR9_9PEZI|nr:hypothetical protein MKZ38_001072 [Zalerion maritima]